MCKPMETAEESVCCCELETVQAKKEGLNVTCITAHSGFRSVCLDLWVLQTAYFSLRRHCKSNSPQGTTEQYVSFTNSCNYNYNII